MSHVNEPCEKIMGHVNIAIKKNDQDGWRD